MYHKHNWYSIFNISHSLCGNTFTYNKNLKDHMLIHAGIKHFTCSQCGKSFTRKNQLKDHLVTHSSEKPFRCSECGNTFSCNKSLKDHMLIHAGIKPFSCSQCGKSFTRKSVPLLWKELLKRRKPQGSHENSHRRETFHLRTVWKEIQG